MRFEPACQPPPDTKHLLECLLRGGGGGPPPAGGPAGGGGGVPQDTKEVPEHCTNIYQGIYHRAFL